MTLSKFEGRKVASVGIEIRGVGGGLQDALAVDPAEWHKGEEVTIALRCKIKGIRHDEIKDSEDWKRVHIFNATEAAVIDDDLVAEALDATKKRIEEAAGIHRLDLEGGGDDGEDD